MAAITARGWETPGNGAAVAAGVARRIRRGRVSSGTMSAWVRRRPLHGGVASLATGPWAVGLAMVVVAWLLRIDLVGVASIPTGGDIAGHVWWPAYLGDHLLPEGRVSGWTMDLFGGFPVGRFYYPIPALLVVGLDLILPYGVAFKMILVAGSLLTPPAAYVLGRRLGLMSPAPELMSLLSLVYLVVPSGGRIPVGGTLESTLAGEFSWSLAVPLGLLAVAYWFSWLRTLSPSRALSATLVALTLLSHVVVGAVVVLWLVVSSLMAYPRRWPALLQLGTVTGMLTAAWLVPFALSLGYTTDPGFPSLDRPLLAIFRLGAWWLLPLVAVAGAMGWRSRGEGVWVLLALPALAAILVVAWPDGNPLVNSRFLPFWQLGTSLVAAVGLGWLIGKVPASWRAFAGAGLVVVALAGLVVGGERWRDRAGVVMAGMEAARGWNEFEELLWSVNDLPPGRVAWERVPELVSYGSPFVFSMLPDLTDGRFPAWDGVYVEASASSPYIEAASLELSPRGRPRMSTVPSSTIGDFALGVGHLRQLGVRYFLAASDATKFRARAHPGLTSLGTLQLPSEPVVSHWETFEVSNSKLVEGLPAEPVVVSVAPGDWRGFAERAYHRRDSGDIVFTDAGPDTWLRGDVDAIGSVQPSPLQPVTVSNLNVGNETISFYVDPVGVPVMVKISYFPSWSATGARGPFRATPNLMVVVPTDAEVTLTFEQTTTDRLSVALTALGAWLLVPLAWADIRHTRKFRGSRRHQSEDTASLCEN